jgi:2-C-methyl-D-erythritol 4-phosphate cytidylyltransferase/2-C-methyl-D-erythritol 2,4-cyclodiphosphate synthase
MQSVGKTVALVVAAGSGSRAGDLIPKQYRKLAGKPLLAHALEHLRHPLIDEVRVVIAPGQEALYAETVGEAALPAPVTGGATRQESVRNGLEAIAESGGAEAVLIHDAARPFLPAEVIDRLLHSLDRFEGAIPALPVADTLVRHDGQMAETVSREHLFRVQTPQAFRFEVVLAAHRGWRQGVEVTDDAQMLREGGHEVAVVPGDPMLEKLTFPEDFEAAERRLGARMSVRTGLGFDVHAFAEGETLWLGGIEIPHDKGLTGHSDADVALHALTDALLGAAGAGDIGHHFPPSDPQWRGAASARFLEHARDLILSRSGRIDHVDLTIICEAPKIGPHRDRIRERIAGLLHVPSSRVSIKATTTERLGFAGRGEGIAAQAVATIRLPEEA